MYATLSNACQSCTNWHPDAHAEFGLSTLAGIHATMRQIREDVTMTNAIVRNHRIIAYNSHVCTPMPFTPLQKSVSLTV